MQKNEKISIQNRKRMTFDDVRRTFASSFAEGSKSEDTFRSLARERGWKVTPASEDEDRKLHFDYILKKGDESIKIDVKGRRRLQRHDKEFNDDYIQLELVGKTGYGGWLYGRADFIAFELEDCFVIAKRSELVRLVKENVKDKFFDYPMLYAKYRVRGTMGVVTMLDTDEVVTDCDGTMIWRKKWPEPREKEAKNDGENGCP